MNESKKVVKIRFFVVRNVFMNAEEIHQRYELKGIYFA